MLRSLLRSMETTRGQLSVEVIVFDNASTDGSAEMVAAEFPSARLTPSQANIGFARGNNAAAKAACGDLLLLLNNDTVVRKGAVECMAAFLADHPEIAAVGPRLIGADGKPQRSGRNFPTLPALLNSVQFLKWTGIFKSAHRRYRSEGFDPEKPGQVPQLAAAALMVRRSEFNRVGGFDEGFEFGVEDVDLCKRLWQNGRIWYLPAAEIEHLGRISSRANRPFVYRGYECGWARYVGKHHGRGAAALYKLLVTLDMPLRITVLTLQWCAHTIWGKKEKARTTAGRLSAAAAFMAVGLPRFWSS